MPRPPETKSVWVCERCGVAVILYVEPSQAPTHPCVKKLRQTLPLTRVNKQGDTP